MKNFLLVANWKANLNVNQANVWVNNIKTDSPSTIVVCPSFLVLGALYAQARPANLHLGAQDVSTKTEGPYTSQVPAAILAGFAEYCIVGHSETRNLFGVTVSDIEAKINNLFGQNIQPVVCGNFAQLTSEKYPNPQNLILALEPEDSISTNPNSQPLSASDANSQIEQVKQTTNCPKVLYGGSVSEVNIKDFYDQPAIDGSLVGSASLDVEKFNRLISLCQ